jgi:antitoxin (DNA-binding transcriptional repressor) of toxin-antitoxin stability system
MMSTVPIHAATTNLSKLLAAGEGIIIGRGKTPIARLTPMRPRLSASRFGAVTEIVRVGPEFVRPVTEAELRE